MLLPLRRPRSRGRGRGRGRGAGQGQAERGGWQAGGWGWVAACAACPPCPALPISSYTFNEIRKLMKMQIRFALPRPQFQLRPLSRKLRLHLYTKPSSHLDLRKLRFHLQKASASKLPEGPCHPAFAS